MNPHQKPQEDVVVRQEDREAAASLVVPHGRWPGFPADFRSGRADQNELTQLLARHRLLGHETGRRGMREAAGKVALNPGFIEARDSEWDEGVNYAKRYIATAIRAIPTEPLGGESPQDNSGPE